MRSLAFYATVAAAIGAAALAMVAFWPTIALWSAGAQRTLQNELAGAVRAVRAGDASAFWALIGASALYGFVHAVGPGHGKLLIGGAAIASRRTAWRLAGLGMAASLTQALSAVVIAYGGLGLLALGGRWAIGTAEGVLAPLSYAAIGLVGVWIALRGVRAALRLRSGDGHAHDHHCGPDCRHAPSPAEVERVESWRDAAALIASIGVRPCSGALIVLVIAWRSQIYLTGVASAVAMAVGAGAVVGGVALAAVGVREAGALRDADPRSRLVFAGVQIAAGVIVALLSAALLSGSLQTPASSGLA